jgi:hypothetical protein
MKSNKKYLEALKDAGLSDSDVKTLWAEIILPDGWRFVTSADKDSVRSRSTYEAYTPLLMSRVRRYDTEHRAWMPEGEYRYFWDDQVYAVPAKH